MAGSTLPEIFCWQMREGPLSIYLRSVQDGALGIELSMEKEMDCVAFFKRQFPDAVLKKDYHLNRGLVQAVDAALGNRPVGTAIEVAFSLTPFQWQVLRTISEIPFGEVKTYGEVAALVGRPGGARAVGQAMGKNPLPLIYP